MSLSDLSIRRPVATSMLYVAVAVVGVVSFLRLPIDLLPDVSFPTLSVWTGYADAGPAEVERFVTEPVEAALSRVPGVRSVDSRSREGQSLVRLQFYWGTDMEFAMLHVRERLDNLVGVLPESSDRPVILSSDPTNDPVLALAVTGADLAELRDLADAVFKRRLEQLDGVALAAITGGPVREIQVVVRPELLQVHGVKVGDVTEALDRANYSAPGGTIRRGRFRYSLRTLGEFQRVAELEDVVVARPTGGGVVRLRDVATVAEGEAERETIARYDGVPAIGLLVYKEAGSNTVRVAEAVEETLEQLRAEFPGVTVEVASSQATFIREAISNVVQALALGGVLAFLVLFLFLRDPRYPIAVGLAIPISVLAAFSLCYLFDVSLNVMSLGGLALGVGMLVDNSIVVLENVFRHREEEGRGPEESASVGAREVAGAITASTLTTIAVFGPVLYVEGVAGALFADLSLAVAFSLLASLLVALTLLPVLAAKFAVREAPGSDESYADAGKAGAGAGHGAGAESGRVRRMAGAVARGARSLPGRLVGMIRFVGRSVLLTFGDLFGALGRLLDRLTRPALDAFDRAFSRFTVRYESALARALDRRALVLAVAATSLLFALWLGSTLPRGMMPKVDEGAFRVELHLPVGTPLEATASAVDRLEGQLLATTGVDAVFSRIGRARESEIATRELSGLNSAAMEVRLSPDAPSVDEVVTLFRSAVAETGIDPQTVSIETGRSTSLGRALGVSGADLAVQVRGQNLDSLISVAEQVIVRLEGTQRLADVRIDLDITQPELEIEVDRAAAARYGVSVTEVADAIEAYLRGVETERPYTEFSEKIDIRVSLPESRRSELSDVLALTHEGVPIGELVRVRQGYGPVEIRRVDQSRAVQVLADVRGGGLDEAVREAESALVGMHVPPLTSVRVGGENEEMRESFRSLGFAFGLALFLVFLIMAAKFESLVQPLVVLASVPLAAIGAVVGLWIAGDGLNAMSGIGFVILIGIVVNDAIIKVDFINQKRAEGSAKREAILEAGRLRLRPILMTTVTTVLGLLPLAAGWGAGADLRAPLAVAVIGGLISATVLTLIVVPVIYSLAVSPGEPVGSHTGTDIGPTAAPTVP
ncbi:MAG: efflux RND transporter permease subunit [marine benthic group bacterium]|nr:efflux RND transporter permease subunit [Gemmatimonadota bacterium]